MPAFGTGVDASLGRIDYTPYLQGSMQGSSALGKGIASLGEAASDAIKKYSENKEMRGLLEQNNESQAQKAMSINEAFQKNPEIFGGVAPFSDKQLKDMSSSPSMSLGKLKAFNAELNAGVSKFEPVLVKKAQADALRQQMKNATMAGVPSGGTLRAALASGMNPEQAIALAQYQDSSALNAAQMAKYYADSSPKPVNQLDALKTQAEINKLNAETNALKDKGTKAYTPGETRILDIMENGKVTGTVLAEWNGSKWVEKTTQKDVYTGQDWMGNQTNQSPQPGYPRTSNQPPAAGPVAGLNLGQGWKMTPKK